MENKDIPLEIFYINWRDIPWWEVHVIKNEPHRIEFVCYMIMSWDANDVPLPFDPIPDNYSGDLTSFTRDKYLRGFINWDGCSHVYVGYDNGYLHLCGSNNWFQLGELLPQLYRELTNRLENYDGDD